jgi:hypothetical protein
MVVHEYDIIVDINSNGHEVTTLYRSYDDVWSEHSRGEELISFIDTGDMMVFPKKEFAGDVQYDRFAELYILISFINKTQFLPLYEGRVEEVIPDKSFEI